MAHKIFTEGCYCKPMQVINDKGIKEWRWVVVSFTEDCTEDGEDIDVNVKSRTEAGLVNEESNAKDSEVERIIRNSKSIDDLRRGIVGLDDDLDDF